MPEAGNVTTQATTMLAAMFQRTADTFRAAPTPMIEPVTYLGIGFLCAGLIVWPLIFRWTERSAARRLEALHLTQRSNSLVDRVKDNRVNRLKLDTCLPTVDFGASQEADQPEPLTPMPGPMFLPLDAVQRNQFASIETGKPAAQVPSPPTQPFALSSTTIH